MTRRWMCLCFILLCMLVTGSAGAEQQAKDNPVAPLLLQAPAPATPALCKTTPLSRAQAAPKVPVELFGEDTNGSAPESCFPAECGSSANPPLCGFSCCRLKCCIC